MYAYLVAAVEDPPCVSRPHRCIDGDGDGAYGGYCGHEGGVVVLRQLHIAVGVLYPIIEYPICMFVCVCACVSVCRGGDVCFM
jgi:hypothetical protein